jgi:hypothetical protein
LDRQLIRADVRETSCTDVAIEIFNRQSATLFPHPGFQACTPGLIDLFSIDRKPSDILSYLCSTLLKVTDYTGLHIVPTSHPISAQYTPFPHIEPIASRVERTSGSSVYRADGVGVVYGRGVSSLANPVKELRQAVKNLPVVWQIVDDYEKGIVRERPNSDWDRDGKVKDTRQAWVEENKPKPKCFDPEKLQKKKAAKVAEVRGDPKLMMVRMIEDGWEQLKWYSSLPEAAASATSSHAQSSQLRRSTSTSLMQDILGTATVKSSGPFRPTQSSSPGSSPPPESYKVKPKTTRPSLNPFRISSSSSNGVKPLKTKLDTPMLSEDVVFSNTSVTKKRRFGGPSAEDKRRSSMKMFTSSLAKK